MSSRSAPSKSLVLAAMIFAVAMTFIDQTIVAIAAPQVQKELGLSSTGLQWAVNAYLLTLAALFPLGGRVGWPGGVSPPGSHGTVRDSLPSHGSSHPGSR